MATTKRLRLPKGFQFILETLAREIIVNQPENIHVFAAESLEKLLKERQDTGRDPTLQESSQHRFGVHEVPEKPLVPVSASAQDVKAPADQPEQASTQGDLPAQDVTAQEVIEKTSIKDEGVQEETTTKDESADLQEAKAAPAEVSAPTEDTPAPPEDKVTTAEMAPAPAQVEEEEEIDIDLNDPEVNDAALKIQAGFRGHKSRKKVSKLKSEKPKSPCVEPTPNKEKELEESVSKDTAPSQEEKKPSLPHEPGLNVEEAVPVEPVQTDVKDNTDIPEHQAEAADHPVEQGKGSDTGATVVEELVTEKEEAKPSEDGAKPSEDGAKPAEDGAKQEEEEEIDIDLDDPEVNDAALKIQAGFRGHKSRKKVAELKDKRNSLEPIPDEGKEAEMDKNASAEDDASAPTQSQVEVVNMQQAEDAVPEEKVSASTLDQEVEEEIKEEIEIDLSDPEVNEAALKIQAGYRGHQSRKEISKLKSDNGTGDNVDDSGLGDTAGDEMELLDLDT